MTFPVDPKCAIKCQGYPNDFCCGEFCELLARNSAKNLYRAGWQGRSVESLVPKTPIEIETPFVAKMVAEADLGYNPQRAYVLARDCAIVLEMRLIRAIDALKRIASSSCCEACQEAAAVARAALAAFPSEK